MDNKLTGCKIELMKWFLAKTDPDTYSLNDFKSEGITIWDGVHSYAAINFIKQMKPGDKVFIYESLSIKAITGLAEVVEDPYENKEDIRFSWAVKLKFTKRYKRPLSLQAIKADPAFSEFALVRQSRLSTMLVPDNIALKLVNQLDG